MLDPECVLDAAARERLLDRFGPTAEPWCNGLAGLAAACSQRWGLELDEALSGGTSRVFLRRQDGARPLVLKLTPDRSIAESEAIALQAWARTPHEAAALRGRAVTVILPKWHMRGRTARTLTGWPRPRQDILPACP